MGSISLKRPERIRRSNSRLNTRSLKLNNSGTAVAKANIRRNSHHWPGPRSWVSMAYFLSNGIHQVFIGQLAEQLEQITFELFGRNVVFCLLYTSPSPRDS